jgi:acylphosphatase
LDCFPSANKGRIVVDHSDGCQRRDVLYDGRVQGVGFRYAVRDAARAYAVSGYVRNLPDGGVQLVAEGAPSEIDRFLAHVAARMAGYIRHAHQTTEPATGQFSGFVIRF